MLSNITKNNFFLQLLVVLWQIEPTNDECMQPYYTQVVSMVGVNEGDYRGTILMDDLILADTCHMDETPDTSLCIIPRTDELSTPPTLAADQIVTTSPTPLRLKKVITCIKWM